jgi:hypothetical protein
VRFSDPEKALQKLMALALVISQNRPGFDERVSLPSACFGCEEARAGYLKGEKFRRDWNGCLAADRSSRVSVASGVHE